MSTREEGLVHVKGVRGPAGEFGAHGVVEIRQNANRVYDFMKRIEDQPQWNPGVKLSQIIKRVANTTHVKQVMNWSFLALRGDFSMNLAMHEEPGKMRIRTEMLHGSMMRHFSSSVGVQQLGPNSCRLEMQMYMQPSICVPFGIRHIVGGQGSESAVTAGRFQWPDLPETAWSGADSGLTMTFFPST
eukprot:gene6206-6442_t